jgi:hypothetical protein
MGYKTHDWLSVWGCSDCNHYTDAYKNASPTEKRQAWQAGHVRQITEWEHIVKNRVGKAREINAAQWALDFIKERLSA